MIQLDYRDSRPLYEQVTDKIERLIIMGALKPDEKLPSVRNLAIELSINPNTVQRAYTELESRGFLYSVKGRGNFVAYRKDLLDMKKQEFLEKIENLIKEAQEMGIDRESIVNALSKDKEASHDRA